MTSPVSTEQSSSHPSILVLNINVTTQMLDQMDQEIAFGKRVKGIVEETSQRVFQERLEAIKKERSSTFCTTLWEHKYHFLFALTLLSAGIGLHFIRHAYFKPL